MGLCHLNTIFLFITGLIVSYRDNFGFNDRLTLWKQEKTPNKIMEYVITGNVLIKREMDLFLNKMCENYEKVTKEKSCGWKKCESKRAAVWLNNHEMKRSILTFNWPCWTCWTCWTCCGEAAEKWSTAQRNGGKKKIGRKVLRSRALDRKKQVWALLYLFTIGCAGRGPGFRSI